MKAIVCTKFGLPEVFEVKEIAQPVPGDDEVLVEIHAASVTYSTLMLIRGKPFIGRLLGLGLFRPNPAIPGADIAGRVTATGKDVSEFKSGDEVFGDLSNCGRGGLAEFVCAPGTAFALKPANMSFAEAAAVPEAALVALQALRDHGRIQAGHKVLIYGASGGIGYLLDSFASFLLANYTDYEILFMLVVFIPAFIAELSLCLWLLLKGVRIPQIENQIS